MYEILKEVCKDIRLESQLLLVTGEALPAGTNISDGARSDISARFVATSQQGISGHKGDVIVR